MLEADGAQHAVEACERFADNKLTPSELAAIHSASHDTRLFWEGLSNDYEGSFFDQDASQQWVWARRELFCVRYNTAEVAYAITSDNLREDSGERDEYPDSLLGVDPDVDVVTRIDQVARALRAAACFSARVRIAVINHGRDAGEVITFLDHDLSKVPIQLRDSRYVYRDRIVDRQYDNSFLQDDPIRGILSDLDSNMRREQADLLRDIAGESQHIPRLSAGILAWNDHTIVRIARGIYDERRFGEVGILHDALLDAGCDDEIVLKHLRHPSPHARGCWIIDHILKTEGVINDDLPRWQFTQPPHRASLEDNHPLPYSDDMPF